MRELKGIIYKSVSMIMKTIIILVAFLMLYIYLPIANRILEFLINSSIENNLNKSDLFFRLSGDAGFADTLSIFAGLLAALFVLVIPLGLIIFLAWRMVNKVTLYRRKKIRSVNRQRRVYIESLNSEKKINIIKNTDPLKVNEEFEKANILYVSGSYQDAINAYTNVINISANNKAFFNRAVVYSKLRNKKQALYNFKAAAKLGHKKAQKILGSKGITWETV